MVINITSEDQRYAKAVNLGMWIGAGAWKGRELVIEYVDLLLVMSCEAMADHLTVHIGWAEDLGVSCVPGWRNVDTPFDTARQLALFVQVY